MKSIAKKFWQVAPVQLRECLMQCLCASQIGTKKKATAFQDGAPVYVIGCFQAGGGISRSAHLYADNLRKHSPHIICVDTTELTMQSIKNPCSDGMLRFIHEVKHNCGVGTVIIHHNPPQFQWILCKLGKKFLQHKHVVGYWAWELEDLPPLWKHALRYVDAVEVPSTFTQLAVAKHATQPVRVMPHLVPKPQEVKTEYGKDGKLRCLFIMDMASLAIRKNPEAVIEAFTKAFPHHEASLTMKLGQHAKFPEDYAKLQALAAAHKNITLRTDWMNEEELETLYLEHDVYISLHRSEGYGLTIREAMLRGLYVVATGWSGNMDFMQGENCFAVKYSLVPVPQNTVFDRVPHAKWAEADVADAAKRLGEVLAQYKELHG